MTVAEATKELNRFIKPALMYEELKKFESAQEWTPDELNKLRQAADARSAQLEKDAKVMADVIQIIEDLSKETSNVFTEGRQYWADSKTEDYGPALSIDVSDHTVLYGAKKTCRESGNYNRYYSYRTMHNKKYAEGLLTDFPFDSITVYPSDKEYVEGRIVYLNLSKRFSSLVYTFKTLPVSENYTPPMRECDLWC